MVVPTAVRTYLSGRWTFTMRKNQVSIEANDFKLCKPFGLYHTLLTTPLTPAGSH